MASCFGSVNAITFGASRLLYAAGKEGHIPLVFGNLHAKFATPVNALLLTGALASGMLVVGSFKSLVLIDGIIQCGWYLVSSCVIWTDIS